MKDFVTKFLDSKGITWKIQDGKIIISSEFQEEHYDKEIDMNVPYFLTEWGYDASLNEELSEFNDVIDKKYGHIFECEWPGTFSLLLNEDG